MTIRFWEKTDSRKAAVDIREPKAQRKWGASGSSIKTDVLIAFGGAVLPAFDTTIDAVTGAVINLYPFHVECNEIYGSTDDNGIWEITVDFAARYSAAGSLTNPDSIPTTEATDSVSITFNFGVETANIKTAIADVRAYNCVGGVASGTTTAGDAATTAADPVFTAADALQAAIDSTTAARNTAIISSSVGGVTPTVMAAVLAATTDVTTVITNATAAITDGYGVGSSVRDVASSVNAGDRTSAATYYTQAQTYGTNVDTEDTDAGSASTSAQTHVDDAVADTVNGFDSTAATDAQSAVDQAVALVTLLDTLNTACSAAISAANTAKSAVDADTTSGVGAIPNFHRMIGVNGGEVEGIDVEVGTVEITVEKKWAYATLDSDYLSMIATYIDRSPVASEDPYTLTWFGQVLSFARGTLRLRTVTVKNDSAFSLELAYSFSFQRNITTSENFTIGNSPPIEKKGQEAFWIFSRAVDNNSATVPTPQSVHIVQVYPYLPFTPLNL